MVQRTITRLTMTCWHDHSGYVVEVKIRYVQSSIAGGKILEDVERYDCLSDDECRDVIEAVGGGGLPGAEHGAQLAMFALT